MLSSIQLKGTVSLHDDHDHLLSFEEVRVTLSFASF